MIFIDSSAYLSLLISHDTNHRKALIAARKYAQEEQVTSYAVLGEILTVGSQKYNRPTTIKFVNRILNSPTIKIIETEELINLTWDLFKKVNYKNIGWVDCYSQAIINKYKIKLIFTFDKDFERLSKIQARK